jgi:hypothetical protein
MERGVSHAARRLVLGLVLGSLACASPTLPLPPPVTPAVIAVDADHVRLVGLCESVESDAIVIVLNTNPAVPRDQAVSGSLASPCGGWDVLAYAHSGDYLNVTQEVGTTSSPPTIVRVR